MLVERPFPNEYAFAQQKNYLLNQRLFGLQEVMVIYNQFPILTIQRYQGSSAEKVQARQPGEFVQRCNNHVGSIGFEPISSGKANSVSSGPSFKGCGKLKRVVRSNYPAIKPEVFAFGPKHAEHARRFYQSKRASPQFEQVLVPPCQSNYFPMQIPYELTQGGGYFSGGSVSNRKKRPTQYPCELDGPVPFIVASSPCETVLKVANISPRPGKMQCNKPKTLFDFENDNKEKVDQVTTKKAIDVIDNEDEIDLSNAPIFQILCEITEMY